MTQLQFIFANNAESTLAQPMTDSQTTLQLAAGGGAAFPNPTSQQQFAITLTDAATGLINEIMYCTQRSTDVLTVVRGQEDTEALPWLVGDVVENLFTAGQATAMEQMPIPVTVTQTIVDFVANTTNETFLAANPLRRSLYWQNIGNGNLTIVPGSVTPVTPLDGQQLFGGASGPPGFDSGGPVSQQAFSGISDANTTLIIWEGE